MIFFSGGGEEGFRGEMQKKLGSGTCAVVFSSLGGLKLDILKFIFNLTLGWGMMG